MAKIGQFRVLAAAPRHLHSFLSCYEHGRVSPFSCNHSFVCLLVFYSSYLSSLVYVAKSSSSCFNPYALLLLFSHFHLHSYVLGLGDRHPSNLMLDRKTGKVLHIDFGDCFEVAMQREKFPEKVPFRLTRMLVNAMEVAGIEGNYRSTCENVSSCFLFCLLCVT